MTYRLTRGRGPARLRTAASVGPAALFATWLVLSAVRLDSGLQWPPEIWGGLLAFAAFVGLSLVLVQESGDRSGTASAH